MISQKLQIFDERCVKCSILVGCLTGVIHCFIFKNLSFVLRWGPSLGTIWYFRKTNDIDIWQKDWQALRAIGQIIWLHLGAFQKINKNIP